MRAMGTLVEKVWYEIRGCSFGKKFRLESKCGYR